MRIVLAAPLYPPEIAPAAAYVKELAKRLSGKHQVTIVAYGRLPEKVSGVTIIAVDKRRPLPLRIISYFFALRRAAKTADVVYAMNGTSVEFPAYLVAHITRPPLILGLADSAAHARAKYAPLPRLVEWLARRYALSVISDFPLPRPEILPLRPKPEGALNAYEASWKKHIEMLDSLFSHDH